MAGSSIIVAPRDQKPSKASSRMPLHIEPMLATMGAHLPADPEHWAFEYKWDGIRAIAFSEPRAWRIDSRNRLDITHRYPDLQALHKSLGRRRAILDGEIVALDDAGHPSFKLLQRRMHVNGRAEINRLIDSVPILYVIFDLLYLDGKSLLNSPYEVRRAKLDSIALIGPSWRITPSHIGRGQSMFDAARQNFLEGVIAKRLGSVYMPARRSSDWLKIKIVHRQEFVIGGWTMESTGLRNRIGTMLLGYHDDAGKLHYAGHVGTGLFATDHLPLIRQFEKLATDRSPFKDILPHTARRKGGIKFHFLKPRLVGEVEYRRWPDGGLVQQASFKGLRRDKPAKQVVKEEPAKG